MKNFFKGLKVVELANVLAGPAVGMFFAELGATVIKIENKLTNGDVTRSWKLPTENSKHDTSAYFASVNWNKESVFVDFNNKSDYQKVINHIKSADIVISNFTPSTRKKFNLNYSDFKKINSNLIYGHISGFGENNSRTAYDIILQAETGFMYMNGTPEISPLKMPVALIDVLAAHHMKEAFLIALIKKMKTGKGSKISVSLFDAAVASLANQATNWLMAKHNPQPIGSLHPNIAPYGEIFITKDKKKIVLAIGSEKHFKDLCLFLKKTHWALDKIFENNQVRVKNRIKLFSLIQNEIKKYDSFYLITQFHKKQIPVGIINSLKEVFEIKNVHNLVLHNIENKNELKRVKTAIFNII